MTFYSFYSHSRFQQGYTDFQDITLPIPITDAQAIRQAAGECLKRVPLAQRIRLLGVRASGLFPLDEVSQETLPVQGNLPF